jgi:hypothetical protein
MENTNTANTANTAKDSEKDLPAANPNQQYRGQEGESHSTAAEGTLKFPEEIPAAKSFNSSEEQDIDDLVHRDAAPEEDEEYTGGQATPLNKEQKFTPDDITS